MKGDCCCLFNKRNQTPTTDLEKLQLLALRFIGFGEKNTVFPRLIFATDTAFFQKIYLWREGFFHLFFRMHMSYTEHHLVLMRWVPVTMASHFSPRVKSVLLQLQTRSPRSGHVSTHLTLINTSMCTEGVQLPGRNGANET